MSNKNHKKQAKQEEDEKEQQTTVYLGYIEDGDHIEEEILSIIKNEQSQAGTPSASTSDEHLEHPTPPWLVNKIGGLPIFPNNGLDVVELDSALNQLNCKQCKSKCVLILQMNSPIDDSPLDRVMQVYTCVESNCSKHTWYSLRCLFSTAKCTQVDEVNSDQLKLVTDASFGQVFVCQERAFFQPYYISVMEEPTGTECSVKNSIETLKLAAKYDDPELKPAAIEEKYKNLKNYQPPKPPAGSSDFEDFEKLQLEQLYSNDKVMYRFYKRVNRYQAQIVRYDWEGEPLLNSSKIKIALQPCDSCSGKRKFEFQIMSALINYLKTNTTFDKESIDFSSIIVHSCSKNCSVKNFNVEDTFFMPDPDSRLYNKVKQKMLAVKLKDNR